MAKIELTNDQLRLIQNALELYSRIGILQFERIFDHPDIDSLMDKKFASSDKLKVGVNTMRGEIVEIGDDYIKTKGTWSKDEEIRTWTDIENIQISPNWNKYHEAKEKIRFLFDDVNRLIMNDGYFPSQASLGIGQAEVSQKAFDIIQVIRHKFWELDPNRSDMTVDSTVSLWSGDTAVNVELDTIKDKRKHKLDKISKK